MADSGVPEPPGDTPPRPPGGGASRPHADPTRRPPGGALLLAKQVAGAWACGSVFLGTVALLFLTSPQPVAVPLAAWNAEPVLAQTLTARARRCTGASVSPAGARWRSWRWWTGLVSCRWR